MPIHADAILVGTARGRSLWWDEYVIDINILKLQKGLSLTQDNEERPAGGVQGDTVTLAFSSDWAVMLVQERQAPGSGEWRFFGQFYWMVSAKDFTRRKKQLGIQKWMQSHFHRMMLIQEMQVPGSE